MYSTKKTKRQKKSRPRFAVVAVVIVVIVLAAIGASVWHMHIRKTPQRTVSLVSTNTTPKSTTPQKGLPTTTTTTTGTTSTNNGGTAAKNPDNTTPTTQGAAPKTPANDGLVSNHQPSLSSSWGTNQESSVCNTSPGATCQITFTSNGVTKSLASEQADSTGAAYWNNWTLQSIGLTEGSWTITATATLNGQTSHVTDPINLKVQS